MFLTITRLIRTPLPGYVRQRLSWDVFAALVAVINSKLPQVGELLLMRLINQF